MIRSPLPLSVGASGTVLVLSPHLDDAVFACGRLLARLSRFCRVLVATVFAGRPAVARYTEWDRAGGFAPGDDVVGARREEDRRALLHLGAVPVWLPFLDSQYGDTPTVRRVALSLAQQLRRWRPSLVLFPLGLFHSDHHLVRDAVLVLLRRRASMKPARCLAYEDALYRSIPGLRDAAVTRLRRSGWRLRPFAYVGSARCQQRKLAAVACYTSQLRALATPGRLGHRDAHAAEAYWQLGRRRSAGSARIAHSVL